jgi:hypothetical protein
MWRGLEGPVTSVLPILAYNGAVRWGFLMRKKGAAEDDSVPRIKHRSETHQKVVDFRGREGNSSRVFGGGAELAGSGLAEMVFMTIFMAKSNSARSMLFVLRIEFGKTGWDENFG